MPSPLGFADVFDSLPHPVVVVDETGAVVAHNPAARELFGPLDQPRQVRCCDLAGCGPVPGSCLTDAALERGRAPAVQEVALGARRVEVTATPLRAGSGAVHQFLVSADQALGPTTVPPLRITTLGRLSLELGGIDLGGEWLNHRPGQVLKYLICARGRRVPAEELVEMLWPSAGRQGLTSLRQAVHGLRDRLEPDREKHSPSRFVVARPNAYELDMASTVVDADEFEREAAAMLTAERSAGADAVAQLAHAAQLYRGEFLAEEPYADWVLRERGRLHDLAARVLRALAAAHLSAGELPAATSALHRLTDVDPLDLDAQRDLITALIRLRRHGEAARRYDLVRRQFQRTFGCEPGFALADLA